MAIRRTNPDGDRDYNDEQEGGLGVPLGGGGRVDEFGNVVPDFSNDPNYPVPFRDYTPEELSGNTESARDINRQQAPVRQQSQPDYGLPMGVSVQESMPESMGTNGMDTPAMPTFPSPVAGMTPNPMRTAPAGPTRRSALNPSIFKENRSPSLMGRSGGLTEGGLGATGGGEASGALSPTMMMQKLLQLFQMQ